MGSCEFLQLFAYHDAESSGKAHESGDRDAARSPPMPGPFPGMDPYLEAPGFWEDCHDRLIFHMGSMLSELLPPNYAALFRQRIEPVLAGRDVVPDLAVTRDPGEPVSVAAPPRSADSALLIRVAEEEALERYLEI